LNPQVFINALPEIGTQLLGFLIVFFILKKYAFKSILGVIDARRRSIEGSFADIEKKKAELESLEKEYRRRLESIEEAARLKIQEASNAGLALAKDIQEKARFDSQKTIERAKAEIEQDIVKARLAMRDEIVEISSLMTEKILREKLDAREHEKMVDKFIKELEKIG
jgi:F-type H+-transporting ATPase subunit b